MAIPEDYGQLVREEIANTEQKIKSKEADLAALQARLNELRNDLAAVGRMPEIERRWHQSRQVYDRT